IERRPVDRAPRRQGNQQSVVSLPPHGHEHRHYGLRDLDPRMPFAYRKLAYVHIPAPRRMLMFLILNSCFWAGMAMLMARVFHELLPRVLATLVVGFTTIGGSLGLLSLRGAIRLDSGMGICVADVVAGMMCANST